MLAVVVVVGLTRLERSNADGRTEPPAAAPETPPAAPPKAGEIDLERSRVYVFVSKTKLGHDHAVEGRLKSGRIRLDRKQRAGSIKFDMATFEADTPDARTYLSLKGTISDSNREKTTDAMLGPAVLDVAAHPTATFAIDSATRQTEKGKPKVELKGKFTLHGQTHDLTIVADIDSKTDDATLKLTGKFEILQTDYGITPYKAALGTVGITDKLVIHGELWIASEVISRN